jgi:CheY-like chemotaxis protein
MTNKQTILLIEDDEIDIQSIERAFSELGIKNPLHIAHNGEVALEYLKKNKNNPPGLILLDLRMPRMNGIEFLTILKKEVNFKFIPVVVLTTSNEYEDKIESFKHGVSGYMMKTPNYRDSMRVIKTINKYWTLSELPYA